MWRNYTFFVLRLQSNSIKQKIRVFFFYILFGIKLSVKTMQYCYVPQDWKDQIIQIYTKGQ